jgi:nucleoside-diphosphate-sugar epimerase
MKVFVAGATGAIGRPLTAQLVAADHEVNALTRSDQRAAKLRDQGAKPVVCDVFDREALCRSMKEARPDIVIHQLTSLPKRIDPRKIKTELAATNRLRREGTRNLFDAALAAGAKRFIAQSIAFAYGPDGEGLKSEGDALYDKASASMTDLISALRSLEDTTLGNADLPGVVLRYGFFYGPGTAYAADGSVAEDVRRKRFPIVGKGTGVFSFIHVDDAAAATVAAMQHGEPGIYNIVDDDPAPVADWLPAYAESLGAPGPNRVPRWLARLVVGPYATYLMCDQRGASNAKAKRLLDWVPMHASWRTGKLQ